MVASNRDLANTYFLFDLSLLFNLQASYSNTAMDMDINMLRDQSVNSSSNSFRASSIYLNTFFITNTE